MHEQGTRQEPTAFSWTVAATALCFGAAALAVVMAGLTIPIPGTGVVTDPRELFTTIGAGLSGPVGAILIGILAGIKEPLGIPLASLVAHVAGGLWMGVAYKKLVYQRLQMPANLLGWFILVLIFYYGFLVPGFVIGQSLFYSASYAESYGEKASLLQAYAILWRGALPESLFTALITTVAILALPRKYRRPLW